MTQASTLLNMISRRMLLFMGSSWLALRKALSHQLLPATGSTAEDATSPKMARWDIRNIVFQDTGPEDFRKYIINDKLLADAYKRKVALIYSVLGVDEPHEEVSVLTPLPLQEVLQKSAYRRLSKYTGSISVVLVSSRMIITIHSKGAKGLSEIVSPGDIIIGGAVTEDLGK